MYRDLEQNYNRTHVESFSIGKVLEFIWFYYLRTKSLKE